MQNCYYPDQLFLYYCLKCKYLIIYKIIFRTKSNIAYNENVNYSEVMENESFNQTAESEEKCLSNNSGQVSSETYSSIVDQPLENEIRDSLTDRFRKPYEKPKKIGTKDKIIEEIKKG